MHVCCFPDSYLVGTLGIESASASWRLVPMSELHQAVRSRPSSQTFLKWHAHLLAVFMFFVTTSSVRLPDMARENIIGHRKERSCLVLVLVQGH